jgi:2-dehydropantoate 2-reductase
LSTVRSQLVSSLVRRCHVPASSWKRSAKVVSTHGLRKLTAERWRKLVWNIPFNGLAVAEGGLTVDKILADPVLHERCHALMEETIAAATALGYPIEKEYADFQIERTYPMGAYQPSTLVDWLGGKELEIEAIWGKPLRQAKQAGISLPHLERLYGHLKTLERGRREKESH